MHQKHPTPAHRYPEYARPVLPNKLTKPQSQKALWTLLCGGRAWDPRSTVPLDEGIHPIETHCHIETPEEYVDRKTRMASLSKEAKYVLDILIKTPKEILQLISTPTGKITRSSITRYLKSQGWRPEGCEAALEEVRTYLREST